MKESTNHGVVFAVCRKAEPGLPKYEVDSIQLIENFGVEGDYHAGRFVRHRHLAKKDPAKPNLRQVLLVDTSIYDAIARKAIQLEPGMMGENILLKDTSVMKLGIGAQLEIGEARLEITEVRNPCYQLNEMHHDLLKAVAFKKDGEVIRNAGMLAIVIMGGRIEPGDLVKVI